MANYPTLKMQRHTIEEIEGQKTTAGLLPNPVLSYYREDLSLGGQEVGEWILAASLDFLWCNFLYLIVRQYLQLEVTSMVLKHRQKE